MNTARPQGASQPEVEHRSNYREGPLAEAPANGLDDEAEPEGQAGFEQRGAQVLPAQHGLRLDKLLVGLAPEFSRSHLQHLLAQGHVRVDGQAATQASRKVRSGQQVLLELVPTEESLAFRPEPMTLPIVFEDEHLLVVNKPAGLVVHPAAGHWQGTLLNGLLAHHTAAATLPRAGIVHRLDKDTSGLMVVGKTLPAVTALVRAIAAREVHREYRALAHGHFAQAAFSVEAPIGRDPASRIRMAVNAQGKPARTDVTVLAQAQAQGLAALRCVLHSGRTHQIRVHLSHLGHPLVADALYGGRPALGMERQALHAAHLRLAHPASGQPLAFEAALPDDLAQAWRQVAVEPPGRA